MTEASARLGVLGLGRLGACLARSLRAAGLPLVSVASRRREIADEVSASLGAEVRAVDVTLITQSADLVFVAVPDGQIESVCEGLPVTAANSVVHLSGVLGLSALESASVRGARVGALHPLQAFPADAGVERFRGIYAGIEAADASLTSELEELTRALGAVPFSLQGVDRAAYHAAAVFASNYLVALHAAAAAVWQRAGLDMATARSALAPLTLGAAQAISERELAAALTGPVARGDIASVARHLEVLRGDLAHAALYRALARELLQLPLSLAPEARDALLQLLDED